MNNKITCFPTITTDNISNLNIELTTDGNYEKDSHENKLILSQIGEIDYIVDDPIGNWNPNDCNLKLLGSVTINDTDTLFVGESKIAKVDTIIGVAVNFSAKKASWTKTIPIGDIQYLKNNNIFKFNLEFEKGSLSEKIELSIILYVKKANQYANDLYAKKVGTILGTIISKNIIIEGNESSFPIIINELKNGPLWDMDVSYSELSDTLSEDTICIKINKLNKTFEELGIEKITPNNIFVWREILADFYENILLYLEKNGDDLDDIYSEKSYGDGTVGNFFQYTINNFEITKESIRNPITLSRKIRTKIEKFNV